MLLLYGKSQLSSGLLSPNSSGPPTYFKYSRIKLFMLSKCSELSKSGTRKSCRCLSRYWETDGAAIRKLWMLLKHFFWYYWLCQNPCVLFKTIKLFLMPHNQATWVIWLKCVNFFINKVSSTRALMCPPSYDPSIYVTCPAVFDKSEPVTLPYLE